MKRKVILWLLKFIGHKQEELENYNLFCINGQPVQCQLCKQVIRYPPIKIPLGSPQPPSVDPIMTPDRYCLNPETIYGRFHISCAMRYLTRLNAIELEYKPNTEIIDNEHDSR